MLEANPTRLFRLLAAQPGLGAALVAAAVAEAAGAAEATEPSIPGDGGDGGDGGGGGGGGGGGSGRAEPAELWLVALLDALLARLRRPEGRTERADGRRAHHVRRTAQRLA